MATKSLGRAIVRIYPGLRIPDDVLVINVVPDDGRGCPFVLLEGPNLPHWQPGYQPRSYMTIDELEQEIAQATLQALGGPDEDFAAQVQAQQNFRFTYPQTFQLPSQQMTSTGGWYNTPGFTYTTTSNNTTGGSGGTSGP